MLLTMKQVNKAKRSDLLAPVDVKMPWDLNIAKLTIPVLISLRSRINPIKYYGHNDHSLPFVYSCTVPEYVFEPVEEAGVDAELKEYAQKITIFPTFLNSFSRAVMTFFRSKVYPN